MRYINDSYLNLAVLLSLGKSSGSGFLHRTDRFTYLVTAEHVLYDRTQKLRSTEIEITCQTNDLEDQSVWKHTLDLNKLQVLRHKKADIAIIPIFKVDKVTEDPETKKISSTLFNLKGVATLEKGTFNMVSSSSEAIFSLKEVLISNDVYVFGYPTSLGLESSPQFDYSKPLLRRGVIANIYQKTQTIILDCPVYGGNSGGPVVQLVAEKNIKYRLIGIVSQYVPYVQKWVNNRDNLEHKEYLNSGYSIATCFDPVIELIETYEKN